MNRSVLLMLAAAGVTHLPRTGQTRLGFAEVSVDNASGELLVDTGTLQSARGPAVRGFGYDEDDDEDIEGDDLEGDEVEGDDDFGDDEVEGDEDFGDDEFGDEPDVGAHRRRRRRPRGRRRHPQHGTARVERNLFGEKTRKELQEENHRLRAENKRQKKGKIVDKTVTNVGTTASSAGQAMTMSITPKSSFWLEKIYASGDSSVLTTVFAGETPIVIDPIDCTLLSASAFRGPTFRGKFIQAGVPITVNYTAGGTSAPLRLTLVGKGRSKSC